ncbi:Yip1 family protein [Streptomyces qinzhouensis]|uniref:YIP1 family protein n=1 Tax=Streptomyces qinzhouensis TaxID=2599401 RepID=A0A5B8IKQ2_9ACTN|nr:Yip1 family protein [Streptomyces qinzhouensis]QDY78019.1 YIP1 family protein [Streptomyces qinzhouensis]
MAGFRIGRGRDNRRQQRPPQGPPQEPPYGQQQAWPQGGGGRPSAYGEPEYYGDPYQQQGGPQQGPPQYGDPHRGGRQQQGPYPGGPQHGGPHRGAPAPQYQQPPQHPGHHQPHPPPPHDPYADNNPGHTQAFTVDDPYGQGSTYQAGNAPAPPPGPRLPWKQLLSGIVTRPAQTFLQMRDYAVWGPALVVTLIYGALAIFGLDEPREEVINATLSSAIPAVLMTAVAFVIGGVILGAVTNTLARQFGGTGAWQPTVGLAMLIMAVTDAPRLFFALFLGGQNSLVQLLGWATWLAAGALFTSMVSKSHDLPWPKALGASAIQLLALLSLIKLGTI